jgi:hypothetical protein
MMGMRVLIAFEDDYRIYRETIAASIKAVRPRVEVLSTEVNELEREARRFEPHLIISSLPRVDNPISALAWIQLSADPQRRSRIWIEEWHQEALNPGIGDIVSAVDEVGELVGVQDP